MNPIQMVKLYGNMLTRKSVTKWDIGYKKNHIKINYFWAFFDVCVFLPFVLKN